METTPPPQGHQKGLYTLFFTEMWERFSYYGMRALLTIFLTAELATGGFGLDRAESLSVYGVFTALVYLTPIVVGFFMILRRKGKEPTTPAKIVLGLFISALSCLVMVGAVYAGDNGLIKVSAIWLIASYGVITLGELMLSPMGLSLVSKLSPPRITALMMGGFFLSTSIGNKLSGVLASFWYEYDNKAYFFVVNFGLLMIATILGLSILKRLNKILKEKGIN